MDSKPRTQPKPAAAKRASVRRGQDVAETARLFLDVDDVIRRSQTVPLTRYIE